MNILAQIFGLIASVCIIIAMQIKEKKGILTLLILGNGFFVINFLLIGAYAGAVVCSIATIETVISYLYDNKKRKLPGIILVIFLVTSLIASLSQYKSLYDIIPIICAVLYPIVISQKKESNIRKISLVTAVLWITYDLMVGAYTAIIADLFCTVSTMVAIARYDLKRK